jgi:hypothetical protein
MSVKRASWFSFLSGLLSLMLCWFFWVPVFGIIITIITQILAIMAIIYGRKIKKQPHTSIDMIDPAHLRNARFGRVMGIIGLFISVICFIMAILFTIYFKFLIS